MELGGGGERAGRTGKRRKRKGGGGRRGGGRGSRPGDLGGTPRALASAPGGVLAANVSAAPGAERKWRVWPRATGWAPPARPSPAVADRVSADVTGAAAPRQRGSRGRDPGREAVEGEGRPWPPAPLQPRPTRSPVSSQVPPLPPGAAAAAALLFVTEESRNVRNVPCVTYLGAENLCPAESARGNITSDEMTMIKISFSPAPSRARRRPGRRVAGRRGAGGWAAEGAGARAHRSREGPGGGPGGKARAPGEAGGDRPAKGGETAHFCRRARQARARGANCDSNPLPRGAAEPRARSRRALPLALAALGNLEPDRCPLRPGWAATGRGLRTGVGG